MQAETPSRTIGARVVAHDAARGVYLVGLRYREESHAIANWLLIALAAERVSERNHKRLVAMERGEGGME